MERLTRKILDILKSAPEVDSMIGKPCVDEQVDEIIIDGHFSIEYLNEKLSNLILLPFSPELVEKMEPWIERIRQIDGVEYEQETDGQCKLLFTGKLYN